MKVRPWPLVVLATLQVLSPLASIFISAWVYQTSTAQVLYWLFQRPSLEIFEFFALMPIAGLAIYRVKRWSYAVFFIAMAWSLWAKVRHWDYEVGSVGITTVYAVYAAQAILVLYFLLPPVRRTYLDPSVRWWESLPRYLIDAAGSLQVGAEKCECRVTDLSAGGARVACARDLVPGEELALTLSVFSRVFFTRAQVVYVSDSRFAERYFGLRFIHDEQTLAQFRGLADGLQMMGFPDRQESRPFLEGIWNWVLTLFRTGKGLLPEPKYRGKPGGQ